MTKKKSVGPWARLSKKYDIQPDMLLFGTHLELRGRNSLSVGGCRGIVEYSPSVILLRMRDGFFRVSGDGLSCDSYTCGEVLISGRVDVMEFEEGKG